MLALARKGGRRGWDLQRAVTRSYNSESFDRPPPPPPRTNVPAKGAWGDLAMSSRAVRVGNTIHVAGTCAQGETAADQMRAIFDVMTPALEEAGASLEDVVATRLYAANIKEDWEELGATHGEIFGSTMPACTLVGAELLSDWMKVEIELTAMVPRVPRQFNNNRVGGGRGGRGGGGGGGGYSREPRTCYNCGQEGHMSYDCPEPRKR
eukprot:m.12241 g.12241  ORF g.12241 m.12241 type:complete len:208 (-) comp7702_c0_seq1:227-850(-)